MAFRIVVATARRASLFQTSTQVVIFQCLASYCDELGKAWPSFKTLAKQCNCSYRTVQRAFVFFKRQGYLAVRRRWNTSSVYQVTVAFFELLRSTRTKTVTAAAMLRTRLGFGIGSRATRSSLTTPALDRCQHQSEASKSKPSSVPSYVRALLERLKAEDKAKEMAQRISRFNN